MANRHNVHHRATHQSGFWFGLALGAGASASVLFLLGTKKGRALFKRLLELSEDWEEHLSTFVEDIGPETLHELKDTLVAPAVKEIEKVQTGGGLRTIIDKIQSAAKGKKSSKKIFIKEG